MSTPVDAERAWADLQRIRVPQERVYDEMERHAFGGDGAAYTTAAIMWVFLATLGLKPPEWAFYLILVAYVGVLLTLAVVSSRKTRLRAHRSVYNWRSCIPFFVGALVTGGAILSSGRLVEWLHLPLGSVIQATVSAGAFVLVMRPANRWAAGSVRGRLGAQR
ncbi:hypothetical protein [Streptomyces sp. NPDC101150]|uniref:hypothetical protein n=1 Tax=Streptomyces sp. NPDC101150 TaxID=3366114 RepID=UPI003808C76A